MAKNALLAKVSREGVTEVRHWQFSKTRVRCDRGVANERLQAPADGQCRFRYDRRMARGAPNAIKNVRATAAIQSKQYDTAETIEISAINWAWWT
jgi:hypothetical protein